MASESLQAGNTAVLQYRSTMPGEPTPVELILDHAVTSTDQQLVCTMAMVCRDWRAATQRAAIGCLHVNLEFKDGWIPRADGLPSGSMRASGVPSNSMRKLFSFAQWLPKHAKIVSRLKVSDHTWVDFKPATQHECSREWLHTVAEPTLGLALRGAAAATAPHGAKQLQAPRLQSYSSRGVLGTSAVLKALPATSLTELEVLSQDMSGLAAALPRLTNLQRLKATSRLSDGCTITATLQAACQLSALTSLEVDGVSSSDLNLLPAQLLRLTLRVLDQGRAVANFSHLTRLTSLDICADPAVRGFTLPVQLIELYTRCFAKKSLMSRLYNITSLRQLGTFSIINSTENAGELLQLGQLANLQNLALEYSSMDQAVAASLAWPQLQQLKRITLYVACPAAACADFAQKLGSVTQLTCLDMRFILLDHQQPAPKVAICHEIAKLKMLRQLSFDCYEWRRQQLTCVQSDIYHLSKLTNLTKLGLCSGCSPQGPDVIDDPTVVRLLLQMKHLEELWVPITGVTVLPVIASLTNLRRLELLAPHKLHESGPQYLQGLNMLTEVKWHRHTVDSD